ncbi:hypothetical protein PVOR_19954 [Paenibacillus vortex V453]|uniref:Uncharacterized protein n=2 Tax=Paenibacillus TaxID=44249 RepID=A0A163M1B7_9BACL|nr:MULTISPECIES: hypothetical protein [Paenibacillus]ANA82590.1 hypothetical protein A3958_22600 [Paenibacillus glucanolyticus]AVV58669.1 hypothetical protein C7121_22380 [Paenibacillus glucanolyticus]AWP27857.1 hypothetical protein B9D94_15060 [Paenibacillus sp. Cedars]EFU40405.1 hypothetical protein PVOR_19954 [Paenibacillus vortex V453]ETT39796.1 hypothetical protein C169_09478 [Paenibacillus sp. FSL R5-808]
MNKKNKMNMWSIGLGSAFLMMMLASNDHVQDGQAQSGMASSAVRPNVAIQSVNKNSTAQSHEDQQITTEMIDQFLKIVAET